MGHYEDAIATFDQLLDRCRRRGEYPIDWGLAHLAVIYIEVGRKEEAGDLITEALRINPSLSLESFKKGQPFKKPAHMQREIEALSKAGVPEKTSQAVL